MTIPDRQLQRIMPLSLEGATLSADELLDLLRRNVAHLREQDPEISGCALHDVKMKFRRDGVQIVAEFKK